VFRALCALPAPRRALVRGAGMELSDTHLDRLAVLAFLHDLGKCNRGFQAKALPGAVATAGHVRELGLFFHDASWQQRLLEAVQFADLATWFHDPEDCLRMLIASLSHHGKPAEFPASESHLLERWWRCEGTRDPLADVADLAARARRTFPAAFETEVGPLPAPPALQHRFAGLVMLADWIGSDAEGFFPFEHGSERREDFAQARAGRALCGIGLDVRRARSGLDEGVAFADLFDFQPTPLQEALFTGVDASLVIAESETGSGKTEAALGYFYRLLARGEVDALYFALPTRVAAREIYARVLSFARAAFGPGHPPVLLAVPGYARVDGQRRDQLSDPDSLWHEEDGAQLRERAWSAERPKRFLAAPIAVGTIDQALLSVMQVNHAHLRAVCLERSLLVVDEVHASDVYLRGLLRALLAHHREAGGRALLLSATLGADARAELQTPLDKAHDTPPYGAAERVPYPMLTASGGEIRELPAGKHGPEKVVRIEALARHGQPEAILEAASAAVAAGARVLVVLNTVARVISLLRQAEREKRLADALFRCEGVICPHHGRFARPDREVLDRAVSATLGKTSPSRSVLLIGSQTLEQSLDIDADWLITDLCPMDVLLQRIGRLHRHRRWRPSGFAQARCTVLVPEDASLEYLFDERGTLHPRDGLGNVYPDLRVLRLTREIVGDGVTITIPRDNRRLVERATHPERLAHLRDGPWEQHRVELLGLGVAHGQAARAALIREDAAFGDPEVVFRPLDEKLATRLGLEDRCIPLPEPAISPFGRLLEELPIPGWMARGIEATVPDSPPVAAPDGLHFSFGGRKFRYTRHGLEREDECQSPDR